MGCNGTYLTWSNWSSSQHAADAVLAVVTVQGSATTMPPGGGLQIGLQGSSSPREGHVPGVLSRPGGRHSAFINILHKHPPPPPSPSISFPIQAFLSHCSEPLGKGCWQSPRLADGTVAGQSWAVACSWAAGSVSPGLRVPPSPPSISQPIFLRSPHLLLWLQLGAGAGSPSIHASTGAWRHQRTTGPDSSPSRFWCWGAGSPEKRQPRRGSLFGDCFQPSLMEAAGKPWLS